MWSFTGQLVRLEVDEYDNRTIAVVEDKMVNPVTKDEISSFEKIKLLDSAVASAREMIGKIVSVRTQFKLGVSKNGKAYLLKNNGFIRALKTN